ncbi:MULTISPECIES: DEAD/DEAH box helicase [unclassified Prochlorococcus]|uniref:DEAD/DEAH box helicase n=1 Tax=unclassified Prochlorococcus TaxID=2627481 RepID=UPI0005338624|nr:MULTISPECIES: DEAD/DEAH box helicase [unclassified Prochlorococcus]KGG16904.1 Helicase [Prochlorococcus sp. MIT 0602]KGG18121.1 Helicase [Prochlorococcus sp. MIT 0603]
MSLLHATWLTSSEELPNGKSSVLFLWAEAWKMAMPEEAKTSPCDNPLALSSKELKLWLKKKNLLPQELKEIKASLTLPSKFAISNRTTDNKNSSKEEGWTTLPLLAGEATPEKYEWWPWQIEGITLTALEASKWLTQLPLSQKDYDLSEEILWWTHLQRWTFSLIANGSWLPQIELFKKEPQQYRARWVPLLNQENERKRLEEFVQKMPMAAMCAVPWIDARKQKSKKIGTAILPINPIASLRVEQNRFVVIKIVEEILDAQLRKDFEEKSNSLDPLLSAWQKALGSTDGFIDLSDVEIKRLEKASTNWKAGLSSNLRDAKTCLQLIPPNDNESLWDLHFLLQAESNPELTISAAKVWEAESNSIEIGEVKIAQPSEILLEGLGRALNIFPTIERGLESATPHMMQLSPVEAFILIKTASKKLRDAGIGVILPKSLSKGLSNRLGLTINAELKEASKGAMAQEQLDWSWELMIGGLPLTMKELEGLAKKKSPLVNHKDTWIELRPNDLKNVEIFFSNPPQLNLNEALTLTATQGNTLMKLPIHLFDAGPRLRTVLEQYHHQQSPEALPEPEGFDGQLRPYQQRGLGWLAFLYRFHQGACLADDMGLGKTIQLLAFIQRLKNQGELSKPILLIAPTSVLTNWIREAKAFTPKLRLIEHYGTQRASTIEKLKQLLKQIDICITSYNLAFRDNELLKNVDWQGIVIDEAQAIKNPHAKQSIAIRDISKDLKQNPLRIALTGTPVENRISELWALMNFLNPKVLGEEDFFNQRYKLPIEHYGDISSLKDLKARVSPFILRRLKTDQSIISDLPNKIELNEWVSLSKEQEHLYNKTVETTLKEIATSPLGQRHGKTLGLLTRLKQICNHPALSLKETEVTQDFLERSSKLQRLDQILEEVIETKDRALLFTQFTEWGYLLQSYLQKKWASEIYFLHGGSSKMQRQEMVDRFQNDPRGPQLFLLSLKAGGLGLNLTRANHVFHIDRWWNPAVENQATDRAYRIGQTKSVIVHKFITTGSIEEKINQMICEKSQLAEDIIGSGENWLGKLSVEELSKLVVLESNASKS